MEKSLLSNIGEEPSMYYSFNNSTASSIITVDDDDNEKTLEASSDSDIEITSSIEMENPFKVNKAVNKFNKINKNTTSTPTKYFSPVSANQDPVIKKNTIEMPSIKDAKKVLNSIENNLNLNEDANQMINDLNNKFEKIKLFRSSVDENDKIGNVTDTENEFDASNLDNTKSPSIISELVINDQIANDQKLLPNNLNYLDVNTSKQLDKLNTKKQKVLNFNLHKKNNENSFFINKKTNQSELKQIGLFSEQPNTFLKPILKKTTFQLPSKMRLKSASSNNSNLSHENSNTDSLSSGTTITNSNDPALQNKLFIKKRQTINAQYTFAPKRRSTNPTTVATNPQKILNKPPNSRLTAGGLNSRVSSIVKTTLNSPNIKKLINNKYKKPTDLNNKKPLRQTMSAADFVRKECPVCFKKFLPTFYDKHVKSHRKNDSIIPGEPTDMKNKCKYCDKTFAISKALTNHLSENCIKIPLHEKKKILSSNYSSRDLKLKIGNQSTESIIESPINKKKIQKLLPPSDRLKPIKKKVTKTNKKLDGAHSGVFTPRKKLFCYLCKMKFDDLLHYTDHNMQMHANPTSSHN